jgi:ATP/maltotriose-dependent transcriptional regulator MalT
MPWHARREQARIQLTERTRVVAHLARFERFGASARVMVVSAPPGSGKAVLLRSSTPTGVGHVGGNHTVGRIVLTNGSWH